MSDTQYGKGTINPLTVTKVERENGSNLSKIYDGGTNVVGGYNIKYTTETNGDQIITTGTIKKIEGSDVAEALGDVKITGKDSANQDITVALSYGTDYTLDTTATEFNSKNVQAGTTDATYATSVNYAITSQDEYGDYVFSKTATVADNGFTSTDGTSANIAGTGNITPRALYMQEAGTFSKTYDGTTKVYAADGNEATGDKAVTINAANAYSGLVSSAIKGGYIASANADDVKNASTAEYTGDINSSSGYEAKDANIYTDGLHDDVEVADIDIVAEHHESVEQVEVADMYIHRHAAVACDDVAFAHFDGFGIQRQKRRMYDIGEVDVWVGDAAYHALD